MLSALDHGEIARQFQQQSLLRLQRPHVSSRIVTWTNIPEEIVDLDAEGLGHLIEAARRNPIDRCFILVSLLMSHANQLGELMLG